MANAYPQADPDLKDCLVRNSQIPEELGALDIIFTDKTGTLTKNEMELKKLAVDVITYIEVD